jgi:O-antigen ligase/polysaccharide polymerase Wzy-like membrane protein
MSEVTEALAPPRRPLSRPSVLAGEYGITLLVAVVVFLVAYDNGGFGESTRDMLAIALWWVVILCVALRIVPLVRAPLAALVTGGLLAAFGALTLASTGWAADAAGAYAEFTRVALYVAVFVLVLVTSSRGNAGRWADGLALGIVAVTVVALVSRLFPGTFAERALPRFLPGGATRLYFPLGYWNGLAILIALGCPLLLRLAVAGRNPVVRGVALVPIPAIGATIYLTSSRAGVATAVVGVVAFMMFTSRRWAATAALVVAGAGATGAVLALLGRDELVNGPLGSAAASSQGHSAALIIAGVCLLTGLLYGVGCWAMSAAPAPSPIAGWILLGAVLVAGVAAVVAVHPIRRLEAFKTPTVAYRAVHGIQAHLLSPSGNGRWQLWTSAIDEFDSKPVFGRGAGSYEAWWAQHGSLPAFVQDAHSLYAETLGELGIVGFLLLVGAFLAGLGGAVGRLFRAGEQERVTLAAVTAVFVAFAVAAAVDWMWELTIVSVVAFACLALATGPRATLRERPPIRGGRLGRWGLCAGALVAGGLLICAIAIPFLSGARLRDSKAAAGRGDLRTAIDAARDARAIEPWSAAPDLQLALLEEQAGNYSSARLWISRAISRDATDWRLWYVRARLETKAGAIRAARRSLARARSLNPRSSLLRAG